MPEKDTRTKGFEMPADQYDDLNARINRMPGKTSTDKLLYMINAAERETGVMQPIQDALDRLTPLFERISDVMRSELEERDTMRETIIADRNRERDVQEAKDKECKKQLADVQERLKGVQDENTKLKVQLEETRKKLEAAETLCSNQQNILQTSAQLKAITQQLNAYTDKLARMKDE